MLVTRTYLALQPDRLVPARPARAPFAVHERRVSVAAYRAMYAAVGARWHWRDRDAWPDARLAAHLAGEDVRVFVVEMEGEFAGYYELRRDAGARTVEIVYFGLVERAMGRGIGGALLTDAVARARDWGAGTVELNTCTLDGPHALANYLARGFTVVRSEEYMMAAEDGPAE